MRLVMLAQAVVLLADNQTQQLKGHTKLSFVHTNIPALFNVEATAGFCTVEVARESPGCWVLVVRPAVMLLTDFERISFPAPTPR